MFCDNLKQARERRGMTGRAVAGALRVTPATYSGWERGKREPSFEMLTQLCRLLDVSADTLLGLPAAEAAPSPLFGATLPRGRYDDLDPDQLAELDRFADYLRSRQRDPDGKEKAAPGAAC